MTPRRGRGCLQFPPLLVALSFLFSFLPGGSCQAFTDGPVYFSSSSEGRLAWVVDESQLPWSGSFKYLSSSRERTALLTVADSSNGNPLGECSTDSFDGWETFTWTLSSESLLCVVSATNSSRVHFSQIAIPRSFSVRIQGARGPRCMKEVRVNGEQPAGCPPRLSPLGFSAVHLECGCPQADHLPPNQNGVVPHSSPLATDSPPVFPRVAFGNPSSSSSSSLSSAPSNPCSSHLCANGGRCFLNSIGAAECECVDGFAGSRCETDVCSNVPCGNGGRCTARGSIAACICPPHTSGILCETVLCTPPCANGGVCELRESGRPVCSCPEGFTGPNCNVVDPCIGDLACALFGEEARCLVDESFLLQPSLHLRNASFDCKCPSRDGGIEWIDCINLHTTPMAVSAGVPLQPVTVPSPAQPSTTSPPSLHEIRLTPSTTLSPLLPHSPPPFHELLPHRPLSPSSLPPPLSPSSLPPPLSPSSPPPSLHAFASSSITPSEVPPRGDQIPSSSPLPPPRSSSPAVLLPEVLPNPVHSFPTPAPMPLPSEEEKPSPPESLLPPPHRSSLPVPHLPLTVTSSTEQPDHEEPTTQVVELESTTLADREPSSLLPRGGESEIATDPFALEKSNEETTEMPQAELSTPEEITSTFATTEETATEEVTVTGAETFGEFGHQITSQEESSDLSVVPEPVSSSSSSSSTTSSTTTSTTTTTSSTTTSPSTTTEEAEQPWLVPSTTLPPWLPPPPSRVVERPSLPSDLNPHASALPEDTVIGTDHQSGSAAVSWIVAIIAIAVVGLVALSGALFILRYVKKSRKLHGKYNPAREEHALSAAYSMPMTTVSKEERLI